MDFKGKKQPWLNIRGKTNHSHLYLRPLKQQSCDGKDVGSWKKYAYSTHNGFSDRQNKLVAAGQTCCCTCRYRLKGRLETTVASVTITQPKSFHGLTPSCIQGKFKSIIWQECVEIEILPSMRLRDGQLQSSMRCSKTFLTSTKKPCLLINKKTTKGWF